MRRVELHVHLDGSIPPSSLLRIAQRRQLSLPVVGIPSSEADIWTALYSMTPSWHMFDLVNEIIGGDEDTLAEVAEGFVAQQAAERVGYTEVRWDPVRPAVSHLAAPVRCVDRQALRVLITRGSRRPRARASWAASWASTLRETSTTSTTPRATWSSASGTPRASCSSTPPCTPERWRDRTTSARPSRTWRPTAWGSMPMPPFGLQPVARSFTRPICHSRVSRRAPRRSSGYAATQDASVLELLRHTQTHLEACPAGHHLC